MKRLNKNKGYAILFSVVIVGIISLISFGLSDTAFKQVILSSLVKDSQTAFYKADTASECALYSYFNKGGSEYLDGVTSVPPLSFDCGTDKDGNSYTLNVVTDIDLIAFYELNLTNNSKNDSCFKISIGKSSNTINIISDGYNICDSNSQRSVEREIKIDFNI